MADRIVYAICDDDCRFPTMTTEQILTAIEQALEQGYVSDPDGAVFSKIKEIRAGESVQMWVGTEAEFNALSPAPVYGTSLVRVGADGVLYLCSDDSSIDVRTLAENALLKTGGTMTGDLNIDRAKMQMFSVGADGTQHYWRLHMDSSGGAYIATGENGYDNNLIQMSWRDTLFARPIAVEGGATGSIAEQTRKNLGIEEYVAAQIAAITDAEGVEF